MNNKRIDVTQYEDRSPAPWTMTEDMQEVVIPASHESTKEMRLYTGSGTNSRLIAKAPDLLAELKKCYAREDELLDALRIIRDDLDEEIAKAHFPNDKVAWQIRNFAHDATQ